MTIEELKNAKIVILSHFGSTGACEELRDWLLTLPVAEIVYIALPFGSQLARPITIYRYCHGKQEPIRESLWRWALPEPLAYAKDFIYAALYTIRYARRATVLVAGDNLLTLAALMTRWVGGVQNIIYYMIDYSPIRFANKFLNAVYNWVDRRAAYNATQVWPLSAEMFQARVNAGCLNDKHVNWQVTPYGCHISGATARVVGTKPTIAYMGDILHSKGAELFVPMMQELLKLVPQASLKIIGDGHDLPRLREDVHTAGLSETIELRGYVADFAEVLTLLNGAHVAIAPYYPHDKNSFTFYADPGKIKTYLGCGLPIVLTAVPPIARHLEREGAGKIASYDARAFAHAISEVLAEKNYRAMSAQASAMGERYVWGNVFTTAFSTLARTASKGKRHE